MLEALGMSGRNNLLIGVWSFICFLEVDHDSRVYDAARYYHGITHSRSLQMYENVSIIWILFYDFLVYSAFCTDSADFCFMISWCYSE
jgi:hypothetical protein